MSKAPNTDIALVFGGGGGKAPPPGGPAMKPAPMKPGMDDGDGDEGEGGEEQPPPEFLTHAEEAFDPERSPEERAAALYRAIKSCGSY